LLKNFGYNMLRIIDKIVFVNSIQLHEFNVFKHLSPS